MASNQKHIQATRTDRVWAALWCGVMLACALFCGYHITQKQPLHSNLLELLPKDERNPAAHEMSQRLASRFQDKLLVLLKSDAAEPALQQNYAHALALQNALLAAPGLTADAPSTHIQQALLALYQPFSQQLLTTERRQWLQNHTPAQLAEQTYSELLAPVGLPRPYPFAQDPFNLGGHWAGHLAPAIPLQPYQQLTIITDPNHANIRWFLITAKLTANPFDLGVQNPITHAINTFKQAHPNAQLLTSGMVFHAAAGAQAARHEISSVGLGSLLGIVVLVLLVFRSAWPLASVLLTLASGCLVALATSLWVFERIHIITLAFGSTLLGVAVDYVLHFLVSSQRFSSGRLARHHLRHAMAIGAITSIAAYLLQLATPFPGMQQMAVFSAAGLLGAWLTVLALAPFYRPSKVCKAQNPVTQAAKLWYPWAARFYGAIYPRKYLVVGGSLTVAIVASLGIYHSGVNDSVASLNTSPKALLQSEQTVQSIMRQASSSRFFLVEAETPEQLLQTSSQLNLQLLSLKDPALSWQSVQQYVPSTAQQEQDPQLVWAKLYSPQGALNLLCQKLGSPCQAPAPSNHTLDPQALYASPLGPLLPPLHATPTGWLTLITLSGNSQNPALLNLPLAAGVSWVDQTQAFSHLLGRYRTSIGQVLLVTLCLLALVLAVYYRRRCWRMLTPLVLSLAIALSIATTSSGGMTVFHLMALLLVLGIGIDTSVFYLEVGFTADAWLAASLASLTSLLAFGLLALSGIAVLHQFGVIVLSGIGSCWLLSPLFHPTHKT